MDLEFVCSGNIKHKDGGGREGGREGERRHKTICTGLTHKTRKSSPLAIQRDFTIISLDYNCC